MIKIYIEEVQIWYLNFFLILKQFEDADFGRENDACML